MNFNANSAGLPDDILDRALKDMILSASGWRGIFAASGGEESETGEISPAHRIISAAAAAVFAAYLQKGGGTVTVIVAADTRPTGVAVAELIIPVLLTLGCDVRYMPAAAAPEIMAFARNFSETAAGFIYISASHNPIGYNGLKFGLTGGGVLEPAEMTGLIESFRGLLAAPDCISRLEALIHGADPGALKRVYETAPAVKREALTAYRDFTVLTAYGAGGADAGGGLAEVNRNGIRERPLGIVCDFNGSARTLSIDRDFLSSLGVSFHAMNDRPGEIRHRIVPEGESLEPCRRFLEEFHKREPSYMMGYVPDCDGDRGNLVVWDEAEGRARILEAQEVFALSCVAELAHLVWTGELSYDNKGNALNKAALAVNDPTSIRIDRIATAFDVSVFRAEVGEANVVGLARKLREKGYIVRILGEGSNGGSIIHPSAVRDPLSTILSLVKLLSVGSREGKQGFFEIWCDLSGQAETYHPNFSLGDIIASLPAFVTTGAYSPEALLRVQTQDHEQLKNRYQALFLRDWEEQKDRLKARYGISGWEAAAYNGMEERRGINRFGDAGRGGLKIHFLNGSGIPIASLWMRGSATEPVFRIMADAEGSDRRMERELIEWQRRLVAEADKE
ncbi:MAG: phosphatidylglycerol lysyltransferase [Treponema sp.]|jgi:phosphoglucomutase|nr:phosphatidylglycerol lysyltransferase [Treponema sp.]